MLSYHILPNCVVLNFDGQTMAINSNDPRFASIILAIKNNDLESIPGLIDINKKMEKAGMQYKNGSIHINDIPMPNDLQDRIESFVLNELPTAYLVKFWNKLKENPSVRARNMLFKFLENNGHPITQDGNFIAYRGVTEDFKDKQTRKFDNSPGSVCSMPRNLVDDDPNNTCSSGLHVACYDYAKGFSTTMVEVEVDPKDVVCVPNDYNGTKMRVCSFKVLRKCEEILDSEIYYETEEDKAITNSDLRRFIKSMKQVAKLVGCSPEELTRDKWLKIAIKHDLDRLNKTQLNRLGGFKHLRDITYWG